MPQVTVGNSVFNLPADSVFNPSAPLQTYTQSTGQTTYSMPTANGSGGYSTTPIGANSPAVLNQQAASQAYQAGLTQLNPSMVGIASAQYPQVKPYTPIDMAKYDTLSAKQAEKASADLPKEIAKSQEQLNQIQPGTKIPNVEAMKGLSEKDIARTSSGEIYRRDLVAEQKALSTYVAKNGQPTTATDWLKFHDAVYKGAQVPGATDLPATQQPAAPEVAAPDGTIDLPKYETNLMAELKTYNDAITQAQTNLAQFQTDTAKGVANVGDQLGRSATLVQGEQYSLKQQRQADEALLTARLGIAQDAKGMALESANIQMQIEDKIYQRKRDIISDARLLRQDQQDSFASFVSLASQSGISKDSFDKQTLDLINKQSQMTGIPAQLYINALDAIYNDKLASGLNPTSDYTNWQLAGGQAGTGLTFAEWQGKTGANSPETAQKATDTLALVKTALTNAKALAGASGRSAARKTAESWFIGATDYTKLEAETNTLRTNVLTLMSDPDIKKFFGPQMSEADVRLMTAAGTTLNPELQGPKELTDELIRLETLINRMSASVGGGEYSW